MSVCLLAIDPGKSSGLAVFRGDSLVTVERVKSEPGDPWAKLEALRKGLSALGIATGAADPVFEIGVSTVVEAQFLGRDVHAMLDVAKSATTWEVAARLLGCKVLDREYPSTWQAAYGWQGRGRDAKWRRKQIHRLAVQQYGDRLGPYQKQIDVHCAALIGAVALMRLHGWNGKHDTPCKGFEWIHEERTCQRATPVAPLPSDTRG